MEKLFLAAENNGICTYFYHETIPFMMAKLNEAGVAALAEKEHENQGSQCGFRSGSRPNSRNETEKSQKKRRRADNNWEKPKSRDVLPIASSNPFVKNKHLEDGQISPQLAFVSKRPKDPMTRI